MMYIKYLIYSICQLFCMALCYLTNPLVVLFAGRQGELPKVLRLWQTWDSALDNRQYVLYDCPRWLSYDFDDYYECSAIPIGYGRTRKMVILKKPFPRRMWLKRYLNRVFWLYRNCGYGFAFYLFGVDTDPRTIRRESEHFAIASNAFRYKNDDRISKHWKWCIYLGWKFDFYDPCRAMIATRFTIHRR